MATKFYLTNTSSNFYSTVQYSKLSNSFGSGVQSSVTGTSSTVVGDQLTATAGGTVLQWLSDQIVASGSHWITRGSLSTSRQNMKACGASSSSALVCGGRNASFTAISSTETYDGTSWSTGTALASIRYHHGVAGTTTSALAISGNVAGSVSTDCQKYNGTTWSSASTLTTSRTESDSAGSSSSAAISFGGISAGSRLSSTESYNGTSWSSGGSLTTARSATGACGIETSALVFGGVNSSGLYLSSTESYNGTSWSSGGAISTAKGNLQGCGYSNTAAIAAGGTWTGTPTRTIFNAAATESYNGTSWSAFSYLNGGRTDGGGAGTSTSPVVVGGPVGVGSTSINSACEVLTDNTSTFRVMSLPTLNYWGSESAATLNSSLFFKVYRHSITNAGVVSETQIGLSVPQAELGTTNAAISNTVQLFTSLPYNFTTGERISIKGYIIGDPGAWATGGALGTARQHHRGAGTATSGLVSGGWNSAGTVLSSVQSYNGTSWSDGTAMTNPVRTHGSCGGSSTAVLVCGGFNISSASQTAALTYNGTSWTSTGSLTAARTDHVAVGTTSSALAVGGYTTNYASSIESFNGTTWSTGTAMSTARYQFGGSGSSNTAVLSVAGYSGSAALNTSEAYNGTSWSSKANTAYPARYLTSAMGTDTASVLTGGFITGVGSSLDFTDWFDGTSWWVGKSLLSSRQAWGAASSTNTAGIVFGGYNGSAMSSTESYSRTVFTGASGITATLNYNGASTGGSGDTYLSLNENATNRRRLIVTST